MKKKSILCFSHLVPKLEIWRVIYIVVVFTISCFFQVSVYGNSVKEKSDRNSVTEINNTSNKTLFKEVLQSPQSGKLTGKVVAESGEPIPGTTIVVKGTTRGVITDFNGVFSIDGLTNGDVLVFSFVGMTTSEIVYSGQSNVSVELREETKSIDEVVIVGYGVQKKATVTGSISSVGTEQLLQSPQANISNALVGRMPGLIAVQRSGEPGADQSIIRIRGIGTYSGSADPLIMIDGIEAQNYNNIDPNEIESITILKDASATAVYGVRGANGVMLITTKRGTIGKPKFGLTLNTAVSSFVDLRQSMNSYDYARSYNEALKYDSYVTGGYVPKFNQDQIDKYKSGQFPVNYPSSDWEDMILKDNASQTQVNMTISGGTPKVKYFVSAGFFNQESLFRTEEYKPIYGYDPKMVYKRYNLRSNFDFEVTKRFTVNFNVSSQIEEKKGFNFDAGTLLNWIYANPKDSPGVYDGKLVTRVGLPITVTNPIYNMGSNGYHEASNNYLNGSIRLNYDLGFLLDGLSAHGTLSYQNFVSQDGSYWKGLVNYLFTDTEDGGFILIPNGLESSYTYGEYTNKNRREYIEFGFDYAKGFGNHNVTLMALYKQSKYYAPNLAFFIPNGYQGLAGRATYDFKKRYLAEFNIGYEGTENFIEGERFGTFPAASLGWVASEESFFPKNNLITYLKIRGTIGQVGNDKIGNISDPNSRFLYRPSSYGYGGNYYFGEAGSTLNTYLVSSEGKIGNPNLTWEVSTKKNLGLEINLFKNRLEIIGDWFSEERDNILSNRGTVPAIVGAVLPAFNLGKMKNSGYEAEFTFRDHVKQFNYWLKANYTYAHNEIVFMDEVQRKYEYQYATGQRVGQYFGLLADGFYNTWDEVNDPNRPVIAGQNNRVQPGDIKYRDINGDGIINSEDWIPIGYSNFPEKVFGISFGGDFKGFDMSVLLQGAANVSMLASKRSQYGFSNNEGANEALLESWTQERYTNGDKISYPRLAVGMENTSFNYTNSSFWIIDGHYLRIKNVEVGYTLNNSLINRWGISSLRLYVNGSNLFTWSDVWKGADPEYPDYVTNSNREPYPVTRTFNFGLNLNF